MLKIVNMIPNSWSDEQNQDCEPNLSVNSADRSQIIGTAFTFDNPAGTSAVSPAMTGNWAPIFSSLDGGNTWTLQFVLPSAAGDQLPTWDVTCRYGGSSGVVYSGLISPGGFTILINRAPDAATQQATITSVTGDQPFLEATTTTAGGVSHDRLYVGYNASGNRSTINVFLDAAVSATTTATALDVRFPFDMPPTRTAIHASGTIYAAFYSYNGATRSPADQRDVVIVKDLNWGASTPAFQALVDGSDSQVGVRVATGIANPWYNSNFEDPAFGNDRYGPDLAVATDPANVDRVFIIYMSGTSAVDAILHLRSSNDGGQNWSNDLRVIAKAKNPSLAINAHGMVGLVYQQVVGANWMTVLEVSETGFASSFTTHVLAITPTNTPAPANVMATYLGDYIKLLAVGREFQGIFCAGNEPVKTNFPSGVTYQRNVNWATETLLGNDGVTPVPSSIDPFFFKVMLPVGKVATAIANSGDFGRVCRGSFTDELLTINNPGDGRLKIFSITAAPADFEAPSVASYPLAVDAGDSLDVVIRFKPNSFGMKSGTITIVSDDPASPHVIRISGTCPPPRLALVMANNGVFAKTCVGSFTDENVILSNSGHCPLAVSAIASSSPEFIVPKVLTYPLHIAAGGNLAVPIRFAPISFGSKSANITLTSDDPASPAIIALSGEAPSGKLAITGSTIFGGVECCRREQRIVSICNDGECPLHVLHVGFKHKHRHFRLINNPFPATLHPGSCLNVVIQYIAKEKMPRACELVIKSDDPDDAVRCLDVLAYTIWDCCSECDKKCCGECGRECCKRRDCGEDDAEGEDED